MLESYKQEQEKTGATVPEIFRARQTRFQRSRRAKSGSATRFSLKGTSGAVTLGESRFTHSSS